MTQKKVAFVLSGGGAKGSLQVGILKQLTEQGIIPNAMYGCSVGALNTLGYTYAGMEKLEEMWLKIKGRRSVIRFQPLSIFLQTRGIFSLKPLRKMVESTTKNYSVGDIEPVVVMNNIETGEIVYVDPWNACNYDMTFAEAVLASSAMPFIMEPVNKVWVDGGVRETVPLAKAIDDGADEIYVMMCNPWTRNPDQPSKPKNWFGIIVNMIDLMTHEVFINDIQDCLDNNNNPERKSVTLHLYAPPYTHTDFMDFSPENIRAGIELGYHLEEMHTTTFLRKM